MYMIIDAETGISLISFLSLDDAINAVKSYEKRHKRKYIIEEIV